MASFIVTVCEAVEALLIFGIVYSYIDRSGGRTFASGPSDLIGLAVIFGAAALLTTPRPRGHPNRRALPFTLTNGRIERIYWLQITRAD